jgi:hypothetical protein
MNNPISSRSFGTQLETPRIRIGYVDADNTTLIKTTDFPQHPADVRIIAPRLEDMVTFPGIPPFQYLDRDVTNTPIIHFRFGWTIEVDRVPAGERPAVIIHLVDLTGSEDQEFCAGRPSGPVRSCAPNGTSFESCANRAGLAVTPMIALRVGVSGGPDFHELAARQRSLVFRKGTSSTTNEENRQCRARGGADKSKLHVCRSYRNWEKNEQIFF